MATKYYYNVTLCDDIHDDLPHRLEGLSSQQMQKAFSQWLDHAEDGSMFAIFPYEIDPEDYDDFDEFEETWDEIGLRDFKTNADGEEI